jgi:hypothetical protein
MHKLLIPLVLLVLLFTALIYNLDTFPPIVWDEGWTATVARNWVERGYYGMYMNGAPAPPGQSAAFPSVLSVAAAFRWFGVGYWQGRFVSVVYMMGAFAALYGLGWRLYGARAGALALAALVPFASMVHMHALYIGRSILAEPVMLCLLLTGYLCFLAMLRAASRAGIALAFGGAVALWSLALVSKTQPLPFWAFSLASGAVYCILRGQRRVAMLAVLIAGTCLVVMQGAGRGLELLVGGQTIVAPPTPGLVELTALNLAPQARASAALAFLLTGLVLLSGLLFAAQTWVRELKGGAFPEQLTRWMLLTFVTSWVIWFLLLSIGWERYLFPAAFIGSLFVGHLLDRMLYFLRRGKITEGRLRVARLAGLVWVLSIGVVYLTLTIWQVAPQVRFTAFARQTTEWLNANVPPDALVETYEIETLFGLNARAHYPPDTVNVEMNQKFWINPGLTSSYEPGAVGADYLVVGYVANKFHLYDRLLNDGAYLPLMQVGSYQIYQIKTKAESGTSVPTK